ncbi:MAG: sensor histidine kinase [Vicinamibacterales bacterium]
MTTVVGLLFLLVYVLGAFAYGSALILSLRQASPVWSPHRPQAVRSRLDTPSLALFGWSALWFIVAAASQFADFLTGPGRGWPEVVQVCLAFGFPPLIMHTTYLEGRCDAWAPRARAWAWWPLAAAYLAAPLALAGALALVFGVVKSAFAGPIIGFSIAGLFTVAGIYSGILMNRNPRTAVTAEHRELRRALNGLYALLAVANLLPVLANGMELSFEIFNRVISVAPLLFLSATTYYENRFEFYDLLVKRGALLVAGVAVLGAFFTVALPWLDALPPGGARPWLFALTTVPLLLAAPWLAGVLGRALDHAWLGRHHTTLSAVTSVLSSLQTTTDETALIAAAERSLKDVLGVTVRVLTAEPTDAEVQTALFVEGSAADPSVWIVVPRVQGERILLSEDLVLLRSLGTVVTYLIENVRLQQRRQEQDLVAQELRVQSTQSELKALRAQINPHFLFNALNTVASLVHSDPARADRAVEQLSEVFRHTLRRSDSEWAPLEQELAFAGAYLDVEEARFGSRLRYRIDADAAARRVLVPAMLVHTLVENAVKHGIAQRLSAGTLIVEARVAGGRLTVDVRDNGPGPGPSAAATPGPARRAGEQFGLRNVRDRLRGHFGDDAGFTLTRDEADGLTVARMEMPVVPADDRRPADGVPA